MRVLRLAAFLGIATLLMSASCYEEGPLNVPCTSGCVVLEGKLGSENLSATPVSGADVKLSWGVYGPLGGSGRAIATTQTNADGRYRFAFQPRAGELTKGNFTVELSKSGYETTTVALYDIARADTTYTVTSHAARLGGKLRIVVAGFPASPRRDTVGVHNIFFRPNEPAKVPTLYDTQTGKPTIYTGVRTTDVYCDVPANQYAFIQMSKKKNGIWSFSRDSIYCPLNQQVVYTFQY